MKNKRSRFRVLLALVLALTILVLPLDTLALSTSNNTATPDEALPTQREKDNAPAAVGTGGVVEVNGTEYSTLNEALSAWSSGSTLKLLSDVTTSSTITVPTGEHTLDLNGHGIKMTGSGGVIKIPSDADLSMSDSKADGTTHYYYIDSATNLAVLASTQEAAQSGNSEKNGSFTGGYLTGGNNPSYDDQGGGGILVLGKLTMNNGTVIGNYVAGAGGGINVCSGGNASITGANIIGNKTGNVGGGVDIPNYANTVVALEQCVIRHNHANSNTGGIAARGGRVTLKDCDVLDNSAQNNTSGLLGQNCHLTVENVSVKGNATANSSTAYTPGLTLRNSNYNNFSFTIKGAVTVENNTMAGKADDSIYIHNGRNIAVGGELTYTVPIKIRMQSGKGEFTNGWKANMGTADPSKYFTSDDNNYQVFLNGNGEAEIGVPPVASVISGGTTTSYSAISDAVNAWTAGSTLKLMTDVTTGSTITVPSGEHTLDLNGCGIKMTGNGAVIKVGSGSTLNMNDSDTGATHKFDVPDGAGLAVLNEASGTYTVNGGYITGGNEQLAGGVYIDQNGTFNMYGGCIIGNKATVHGGGVDVSAPGTKTAIFNMYGGSICYNSASWGGGINVFGTAYVNEGCTIHHNTASNGGGGIELENGGKLYLNGSTVTENVVLAQNGGMWKGGGVHIPNGTECHLQGAVKIKDNYRETFGTAQSNVFVRQEVPGKVILDSSLTSNTPIGVGTNGAKPFTVTSAYGTYHGTTDPSKYFTSDYDDCWITLNNNGEAEVAKKPVAMITSGDDTSYYSDLSSALSAWTAGSTLKLLADVTTDSTITVPSGEHTLDLNGYALKAGSTGYSVVTVGSGAELTIDDTSDNIGKITGGSVGQNYGGGVTVDGGTLTLKGGAVSGNANTHGGIGNCGGGVHVRNSGKFYMEGGEISGNTSYVGGGVCSDASATTVSITGGVIKSNKTDRFGSAIWAGRSSSAVFRIGGDVQIIDNISTWTADKDGEASVNFVGELLLSGDPTVHGDWKTSGTSAPNSHINLDNDGSGVQRLTLEGALTNDTGAPSITMSPIYRWNDLRNGKTFVFTKNWNKYMGTAHPADYFKLDDSLSGVTVIRKDGEAAFTGSGDLGDLYITFDANGGESEMDAQLAKTSSVQLNKNTFTHKDLVFGGWNTKKDGSGTAYADGANITLSGDLTLYAQWKEPVASIISGETTTSYSSLSDAVNAWTAGSTLKLLSDVSNDTTITVSAGEHILDLNGHTLLELSTVGKFMVGSGASSIADLTIIDSVGTGVLKHETGRPGSLIWIKEGSSLTLDGGTLEANSSASPVVDFFQQKNSSFTMNGGKITGTANNGAVRFGADCTFTMTGGEISGLQTSTGLFDYSVGSGGAINISGAPVVKNNTANGTVCNFNLPDGRLLNINGEMTDGASVGVTKVSKTGVFTSGWKDKMGDADPADYFMSDNSDYVVALADGEAVIRYPDLTGVTASGFEGGYDGMAHGITVTAPNGATIKYGTSEGSYTLTQNPTYTNAGTYTVYYEVSKDKVNTD